MHVLSREWLQTSYMTIHTMYVCKSCIRICMCIFLHTYVSQICNLLMICFVVAIIGPPENTTVCRSNNVTISCGYIPSSANSSSVTWIINGMSFDEALLMNSPLYQLNNPTNPPLYSLTVFTISHTTTFQCVVHETTDNMRPRNIASTRGTVTVIGMYVHSSYVASYIHIIVVIHM